MILFHNRRWNGYKNNWVKTEIIDGIKITRVPLYAYHGSSKVKRVINYFSFAVSSIFFGFPVDPEV